MTIKLNFDAGDDMSISGKCYKKQSTVTSGTPDTSVAGGVFSNCTNCVGYYDNTPPTGLTTVCSTTINPSDGYGFNAGRRVNGVKTAATVPDIMVRVTAPANHVGALKWCGQVWTFPADNGKAYRICPFTARLITQTAGNHTSVHPDNAGPNERGYAFFQFGTSADTRFRLLRQWNPDANTTITDRDDTRQTVDINAEESTFAGPNNRGRQGVGPGAPGAGAAFSRVRGGNEMPRITTSKSYRGNGMNGGPGKQNWHLRVWTSGVGPSNLHLRRNNLTKTIIDQTSVQDITLAADAAVFPANWITNVSRVKGQEGFLFEWFEGNNWAAWNAGV